MESAIIGAASVEDLNKQLEHFKKITGEDKENFIARQTAAFEAADANNDGIIEKDAEFDTLITPLFEHFGLDQTQERKDYFFDQIDANKNSKITKDEYLTYVVNHSEQILQAITAELEKRGA